MIIYRKELILIRILYYRRDYVHLLNDFTWQTEDYIPHLPRAHQFLNYWKENIDAVIKDVEITTGESRIRSGIYIE
jgi:uncharacterized protein Usg